MFTQELLQKFNPQKNNMLQILHALQDAHPEHYLTDEAMRNVAKYLNISLSSVYGVATYYTMFSIKPRGKYIIRVCQSPVCRMLKSSIIFDTLKEVLNVEIGKTTGDKLFTLEVSECLGRCGDAVSMMVNESYYGNLTPELVKEIIEMYKNK
jgi:NADH-quinone oxidoreductase subunit E